MVTTCGAAFGIGYLASVAGVPAWLRGITVSEIVLVLLIGCLLSLLASLAAVLELVEEAS